MSLDREEETFDPSQPYFVFYEELTNNCKYQGLLTFETEEAAKKEYDDLIKTYPFRLDLRVFWGKLFGEKEGFSVGENNR